MAEKFRVREETIYIKVTKYEKQTIQERVKAAGCLSMREYLVKAAIDGYIINVDYSELKKLAFEINKIGVNINQIAHKINSENIVYQEEINELKDGIDRINHMLRTQFYHI